MKFVRAVLLVLALAVLVLVLTGWYVSRPLFDDQRNAPPARAFDILPVDEALTFARTVEGRLLLVLAADERHVSAVDLVDALGLAGNSPLEALQAHGYERLSQAAAARRDSVPTSALGLPFDPAYPHIAAGTNFKAHADEVGLDGGPFLFPKLSRATPWNAAVPAGTRLDYEAELCAVTLGDFEPGSHAGFGYVICNDFTDRWLLLREIDLGLPMGRTGFADAKGGQGRLPIGPFLVVPRDAQQFHRRVTLGLAVNGSLRQEDSAQLMIWPPHEIARGALAACEAEFASRAGSHRLVPCAAIPAGTLILTGTPAGVMFHYLNIWRSGSYLRPGDQILTWADHLGILVNKVL